MPGAEEVYRLIRQVAPSFAAKLQSAAAASHNESELRTQVAHHIQELAEIEAQVDQAAAGLWGIAAAELREVQRRLAELSA